ncbi:hypothetical protein [Microbacterium deminutum]|uniref:Uncharacterized protein n=1 Tax=Microbacterium deminutum TaxID=344164 RepID=A0ABP5C4Z0_9MICO
MPDTPSAPSTWWGPPHPVWRSGAWSLERRGDEFADISFEGRLVARSVRAVVRDRNWDTAPLFVDHVRETDATLTLHVRSHDLGSSFRGVVRVEARARSLVVFTDLESETGFATNRTGLVVLHPPFVAGATLRVTHSDGSVEQTAFPTAISPHQPVFDIAALGWHANGLEVSVAFDGDVFEMEDQRNWTDASFKTYSRPLALPFPYPVPAGGRVAQTATFRARFSESAAAEPRATSDRIVLHTGGAFPAIGLGASTAPEPAPEAPSVGDFVQVELDLASSNWRAALARAARSAKPLDVRFLLDPDRAAALADGVEALRGVRVIRAAAFHQVGEARHVSDRTAVAALRAGLAAAGIDIPVVGGARSHFTELNRERHRIPGDLDGTTVTVTPLFHALGTEQLVESVAMQRLVAQQTVTDAGGADVHVGPVVLRPRFNDVATASQPGPKLEDLSEGYGAQFTGAVDSRQTSDELAAWTVASAAALAVPGVASLAFFEEWGPRGIRSASGDPFPVLEAISALTALEGDLLWADSPDGELWAIGAHSAAGSRVLVANIGRGEREVAVTTPHGEVAASVAPGAFVRLVPTRPLNTEERS